MPTRASTASPCLRTLIGIVVTPLEVVAPSSQPSRPDGDAAGVAAIAAEAPATKRAATIRRPAARERTVLRPRARIRWAIYLPSGPRHSQHSSVTELGALG